MSNTYVKTCGDFLVNFWFRSGLEANTAKYWSQKKKYFDYKTKTIFSTSAKIGLSCNMKSLFQKSIDKDLQIFTFIFHPVLYNFFDFFITLLSTQQYLSITKKIIKFRSLLIKLWSLKKNIIKKLDFNLKNFLGSP